MLKLIVSQAEPKSRASSQSQKVTSTNSPPSFAVEVRLKGPNLYLMTAQDPSHYLNCDLTLEIEESPQEYKGRAAICHYPKISGEQMNILINEDETLYEIVMTQFQMKILEKLFSFCIQHQASHLIIYTDTNQHDELEIYQEFLVYSNKITTRDDEQIEMIIPINQQTFGDWTTFKGEITLKMRQSLWQNQRTNSAIRQYLKDHPLG